MLKIEAIFRPERVNAVTDALTSVGVTGFHYQNIQVIQCNSRDAVTPERKVDVNDSVWGL